MKVKKIIEHLENLDPESDVVIWNDEHSKLESTNTNEIKVIQSFVVLSAGGSALDMKSAADNFIKKK